MESIRFHPAEIVETSLARCRLWLGDLKAVAEEETVLRAEVLLGAAA